MPYRPTLAPRIAFVLIGLAALVQAGACLDFDGLAGGAAPFDAGPDVIAEVDGSVDAGEPDAPPRRIVLRGTAQAGPVEGTMPLVLALPPGIQPGDVMLLALVSSSTSAVPVFTPDAGAPEWVSRFTINARCKPDAGPATMGTFTVQSKVATSGEGSVLSVLFDVPSSTKDRAAAILSVWGGTDPTSPIDTEFFAGTDDLVAPGLATTVPNAQLAAFFVNPTTGGAVWTAPAGMTTRASTGYLALFDEPLGAPGPTGPRRPQTTATEICGAAAMLALRPNL